MQNDLGRERIPRLVWRVALSGMLAQFVSVLYSIVDRMYIGHIQPGGELALAGAGICGPVVTMIGSAASLVGIGGSTLMGISLGEGDMRRARGVMANAFWLLLAFSAVLMAALAPVRRPMLSLFGASSETLVYAEAYFLVYMMGTPFALLATGLNPFIVAQGFARRAMLCVVLGAALNIALDPLFIFTFGMGVKGAALATVLSQAASCGCALCFLFGKKALVRIHFERLNARLSGKMMALGLTPFCIIAVDNVMIIAMNAVLKNTGGAQGDTLITCATIVQSFMLVVTMPLGGISGGTQAILSYNYGARKASRVREAQRYIFGMCVGYTAIMFVAANLFGAQFARLFSADALLCEKAAWAIRACTLAIIPLGVQYEVVDGFTAIGQVRYALPLSFWRKGVYFAALFTLPVFFGAEAAFYAEPISDIAGPVVSTAVYFAAMSKILKRREQQIAPNGKIS